MRPSILIVDDDDGTRGALTDFFCEEGFAVASAREGESALAVARSAMPDLVLTDLEMPLVGGVELCRRLREMDQDLPVIVMTAHSDLQLAVDSLRVGADDYLTKPLELSVVHWCVQRVLARRADKRAHAELQRVFNEHLVISSIRQKELAETAERHRAHLNALLENLSEGVMVEDGDGQLLIFNRAARTILQPVSQAPSAAEINALAVLDLSGRALPADQYPLARAARGDPFADYEVTYALSNGERRRVSCTGTSVGGDDGKVAMAIVVFRDVTEIRRLEQQRDEYLGLISHDLRNPLNSILMSVSSLKASLCTPGATPSATVVERAERSVRRMSSMLDELSEATSLESQAAEFLRVTCDMHDIVKGVVDSMDLVAAGRITLELNGAEACYVCVDRPRVERVVVNLLTNALKYSAKGAAVRVRLGREGETVQIDVIDSGIGIAPEDIEMLFSRYYRTNAGKSTAAGLGLGLYIARLIIERHGGHIEVSSEVGKGSRFRVVLPSRAVVA